MWYIRLVLGFLLTFSYAQVVEHRVVEICQAAKDKYRVLYQSSDGWLFVGGDFYVPDEIESNRQDFVAGAKKLSKTLNLIGTRLVLVPVPTRGMIYANKLPSESLKRINYSQTSAHEAFLEFIELLRQQDILTIDLLTPFINQADEELFFRLDGHWNTQGSRLAAAALAQQLSGFDTALSTLTTTQFYSRKVERVARPGSIEKLIEEACNSVIEDEEFQRYDTLPVGESTSLLGDVTFELVLVGTSFSGRSFNFDGFLSEALQKNVLLQTVAGGGLFTSIQNYLLSDTFRQSPPRYLIWEFPIRTLNPGNETMLDFRQLVPSVLPVCTPEDSLVNQATTLASQTEFKFEIDPSLTYQDPPFIYVEFSDHSLVEFEIGLIYQNGVVEQLPVKRSTRIENSGKYYFSLNDEISSSLSRVTFSFVQPETSQINFRLCKAPL